MKRFDITVHIFIKPAVLNPEEKPIAGALKSLGYKVSKIRMGKCHVVSLEAADEEDAKAKVTEMAERLLTNPVTEGFEIDKVVGI